MADGRRTRLTFFQSQQSSSLYSVFVLPLIMSSAELLPLFPSATHPALPIAAQILSTLRSLTAPGRGNDLRAEERTALVGVAALMGCERQVDSSRTLVRI